MKFYLPTTEIAAFHTKLRAAAADETDGIVDDYAQLLVDRTTLGETDGPGLPFGLDAARAMIRSISPVDRATFQARISCCKNCDHVKILAGNEAAGGTALYQCGLCQCVMNAKAMLRGSKCPDGRF